MEIASAVAKLPGAPDWVTLSGGNPALLELGELVAHLHAEGRRVAVETQGSVWRNWLGDVDLLTISPKPPSSGMATVEHEAETRAFIRRAAAVPAPAVLKVVVFDEPDYAWASGVRARHPALPFHLSCGTDPPAAGESHDDSLARVSARYRWLAERASADPDMAGARILPQLHVLAWGHERGH